MVRRKASRILGFTLIEVIMVMLIIGLLLSLLLPALGAARETGRRTQCVQKVRQLALAVQQFEVHRSHYPGWRYTFTIKDQTQLQQVTWPLLVLPYTQRRDVYERYQQIGPSPQNVVCLRDLLVCPSDFEKAAATGPTISYVGNTGRVDDATAAQQNKLAPDARANAVFLNVDEYGNGGRICL